MEKTVQRTQDGVPFQYVKLVADQEAMDYRIGKFSHPVIQSKALDRMNILINSDDRTSASANSFDFYIDLGTESANMRNIKMVKFIGPLLPQINDHNNLIKVVLNGIAGQTTLTNGYYTPNSYVNMLQSVLSALWNSIIVGALVTVAYNPSDRNITITDISPGPGPYNWYFDTSVTDLTRSYFVNGHIANFNTGIASAAVTQTSTSLEMIYSRYLIIRSNRLCQSQRAYSLLSSHGGSDIIAIIDLASGYTSEQFNTAAAFPSTTKVFNVADTAPIINTSNKFISLRILDINIQDEYGFNLSTIYADGSFAYSNSLWFVCDV